MQLTNVMCQLNNIETAYIMQYTLVEMYINYMHNNQIRWKHEASTQHGIPIYLGRNKIARSSHLKQSLVEAPSLTTQTFVFEESHTISTRNSCNPNNLLVIM